MSKDPSVKEKSQKPAPGSYPVVKKGVSANSKPGTHSTSASYTSATKKTAADKPKQTENGKSASSKVEFIHNLQHPEQLVTKEKFDGSYRSKTDFDFVSGIGQSGAFKLAKKKGASFFASVFIMAQASYESGWGLGNGGEKYHALFSVMGGAQGNIKTKDGNLSNFSSYEQGFNYWWKNFDEPLSEFNKQARFPGVINELFQSDHFTPDDVNKYYHQFNYYPAVGDDTHPPYTTPASKDYGEILFERMNYVTDIFMQQTKEKIQELTEILPKFMDSKKVIQEEIFKCRRTLTELQQTKPLIQQAIEEHKKLIKDGKIKPTANPHK